MASGPLYCKACGATGTGVTATPGSFFVELLLWLCFLIPGLIYSVWRLAGRKRVCRICGSDALIPADSPAARAALELSQLQAAVSSEPKRRCPECAEWVLAEARRCRFCGAQLPDVPAEQLGKVERIAGS
jgi:hypothetical protein